MPRDIIWTASVRDSLYRMLMRKLGPLKEWGGNHRRPAGYTEACQEIAESLNSVYGLGLKGTAVQQQVAWVTSKQAYVKHDHHRGTQFRNVVAALDAGFIKCSYFDFINKAIESAPQHNDQKKGAITIGDVTYEFSLVSDSLQKKEKSS